MAQVRLKPKTWIDLHLYVVDPEEHVLGVISFDCWSHRLTKLSN